MTVPYPLALVKPTDTATTSAGSPARLGNKQKGGGGRIRLEPKKIKSFESDATNVEKRGDGRKGKCSYPSLSTRSACG